MRRLAGLAPLAAAAIWGGMYVVSKWGFSAVPPLALVFLRVVLGAAVLLAVVRATKPAATARGRTGGAFSCSPAG
jgi:drug/metabolite transporter (DMT)-like permease